MTALETPTLHELVEEFQKGNAQGLIDWYNDGADGQINWGEPGDFQQCVDVAGAYVDDPEGFCQERHIDATGEPAGKGAHGGTTMKGSKRFADGWDAAGALSKLNPTSGNLKKMHAYKDPEGDPEAKGSYSFPHHDVNADGSVGAANPAACSSGIGAINGGRGGHSLEPDEKTTVYNHLANHLRDAGQEPPELKGGTGAAKAGSSVKTKSQFALADDALGDGTGPVTNKDANNKLHSAISDAVSDAHPHDVSVTSSSDPEMAGKIAVAAQHDDGSKTLTTHVVGKPPAMTAAGEPALALLSSDGDDDNDPDCESAQIGAVGDALADAGVGPMPEPMPPPSAKKAAPAIPSGTGANANTKRTLTADLGDMPAATVDTVNRTFEMPIMVIEGIWTGDWRYVDSGALSWRDLPLPAMALTKTTMSHDDADLVGKINSVERREFDTSSINSRTGEPYPEGTTYLMGKGEFASLARAEEVAQLIADGFLRGLSVDIGDAISDYMTIDEFGNEVEDDWDLFDFLFGFTADAGDPEGDDDDPIPQRTFYGEKIRSGRIMGATICPFPAFEGAYVTVGDISMAASVSPNEERGSGMVMVPATSREHTSLVAAAAPMEPPIRWFLDPEFDGPTAIEVEKSGRVFGHLAIWNECHIGYMNSCVKPPHSKTDYSYYHVGSTLLEDGSTIPTGVITMNTGHAEIWMERDVAKAHYDNTGMVVADVRVGEDAYGIWVAGALRPDVDELSARRLRGAALSGDWRQVGVSSELIAALAVNTPGFPIARPKSRVASGQVMAIVAAGRLTHLDAERLRRRKPQQINGKLLHAEPDPVLAAATMILDRQARKALRAEVHR